MLREMQTVKDLLIQKIQSTINRVFPNYQVELYGSHATGLCLHWSDIDFVVGPVNDMFEKDMSMLNYDARIKESLRRISDTLRGEIQSGWVVEVNYID